MKISLKSISSKIITMRNGAFTMHLKSNTSSLLRFIGEKTSPPSSIYEITNCSIENVVQNNTKS